MESTAVVLITYLVGCFVAISLAFASLRMRGRATSDDHLAPGVGPVDRKDEAAAFVNLNWVAETVGAEVRRQLEASAKPILLSLQEAQAALLRSVDMSEQVIMAQQRPLFWQVESTGHLMEVEVKVDGPNWKGISGLPFKIPSQPVRRHVSPESIIGATKRSADLHPDKASLTFEEQFERYVMNQRSPEDPILEPPADV